MRRSVVFKSRAEIAQEQEKNFAEMMDLVASRHPYYRDVMASHGLRRDDFRSLADLRKLPITTKAIYMAEPSRFCLETAGLPEEMQSVWDVMYTTGSTTRPTPFVTTTYDFYHLLTIQRSMMEIRGVGPTDIFANLYPVTRVPQGAFHRAFHAACVMNVPIVSALPGNPSPYFVHGNELDEVVDIVARNRATVLHSVPSYARRVLKRAEELKADFSPVRMLVLTGEPLPKAARDELLESLGRLGTRDAFVSGDYGATEMQSATVECGPGSAYHNPAPDQFYLEIVDPETHEPLPDGQEGLILVSHLNRRGTVLLRYSLGDATVMERGTCPRCGANTDLIVKTPYRVDRLVKIKGMLVNPDLILEAIAECRLDDFQIVIAKQDMKDILSMDRLTIRVVGGDSDGNLSGEITQRVKRAVGVTPVVEFVDAHQIDNAGSWKAKRLLDLRPKA